MASRYAGPIIDAHHHLWDLSMGRHPWLTEPDGPLKSLGNLDFLRRDYLIADYLADAAGQDLAGSVFVEAVWDRARPVDEEVRWVAGLARPPGIAARMTAWAPLDDPGVEDALDRLAATGVVAGVRETVRWHPDPAKAWAAAGILDNPAWRRGAAMLGRRGWLLEVLMYPQQAEEVVRLARDLPDLQVVVNHCGSPTDRDEDGMARWRAGLRAMGECPNVALKLSNFGAYAAERTPAGYRDVLAGCIEAFGPERAMFATDYPVGRRTMPYAEMCARFGDAVEGFSLDEQALLWRGTAARVYGFQAE